MGRVKRSEGWEDLEESPESLQKALEQIREAPDAERPHEKGQHLARYSEHKDKDIEQIRVGIVEPENLDDELVRTDFSIYNSEEVYLADINSSMNLEEMTEDSDGDYESEVREISEEVYKGLFTAAKESGIWSLEDCRINWYRN